MQNDDGEMGGGGDPGGMIALGATWRLGTGVADVAPGELVGWVGVSGGVRATEAYDRGGLPGGAIAVLQAGVVGVGGAAAWIGGDSRRSVGVAGVGGGSS